MMMMMMVLSVERTTEPDVRVSDHKMAVRLEATQLIKKCRSHSEMVRVT